MSCTIRVYSFGDRLITCVISTTTRRATNVPETIEKGDKRQTPQITKKVKRDRDRDRRPDRTGGARAPGFPRCRGGGGVAGLADWAMGASEGKSQVHTPTYSTPSAPLMGSQVQRLSMHVHFWLRNWPKRGRRIPHTGDGLGLVWERSVCCGEAEEKALFHLFGQLADGLMPIVLAVAIVALCMIWH